MNRLTWVPLILAAFLASTACYPPRNAMQKTARKYQSGKLTEDTSYIYQLPFRAGTKSRVIQGYFSRFTHKHRAALDFRMRPGTEIRAARSGIVIRTKDDSNQGGWNKKYRPDANFVMIEHEDSSRASYRHLKYQGVLVKEGEKVTTGQVLGYSGKTGYSALPHLHFMVSVFQEGRWVQIPTRFESNPETGYLRPWRKYKSVNVPRYR
ncbi:MAG TPA: M23 family metallopeptidase [Saprospiraceae bacterium]|nr:M23 family metallopeptidase [Saprospiraceae bacterium]